MERFFRLLDFKTFIDNLRELVPEIEASNISEYYCDLHTENSLYRVNILKPEEYPYQDEIGVGQGRILSIHQSRKHGDTLVLSADNFDRINYGIVSEFIKGVRNTFYNKFDTIIKDLSSLEDKGLIFFPEKTFIINPKGEVMVRMVILILNTKRDVTGSVCLYINLDTARIYIYDIITKDCSVGNIELEYAYKTIIGIVNYTILQDPDDMALNYLRD